MARQRPLEVIERAELVTIGELVRLTGMRYSTLKFYTEEGIHPFRQEKANLTRRYLREETIGRLAKIRQFKAEALSVPQIMAILKNEV